METIAVYWEPMIKTYGFEDRSPLCLVSGSVLQVMGLGQALDELSGIALRFVQIQWFGEQLLMQCAVDQALRDKLETAMAQMVARGLVNNLNYIDAVTLMTFHGPHYGDRYGIAQAVFEALGDRVRLYAAGFAGAGAALILDPGDLAPAQALLGSRFEIPAYEH